MALVWVRLGSMKRSPTTKSSNQRCSATIRWCAGSKSGMASVLVQISSGIGIAALRLGQSISAVMPGLVPGIHVSKRSVRQDVDRRYKPGHDGGEAALQYVFTCENLPAHRPTFRAARRCRPDAACGVHVLLWRCDREVHRRDLFGRAAPVPARLCGAVAAGADDLAAAAAIQTTRAAAAAIGPRRAVDARGRGVLPRHRLPAAR